MTQVLSHPKRLAAHGPVSILATLSVGSICREAPGLRSAVSGPLSPYQLLGHLVSHLLKAAE